MSYTITDIEAPEFSWDFANNKATAKRTVLITPWDQLWQAAYDLSGSAFQAGNIYVINLPATFPGQPQLWLHNVKAKPFTNCFSSTDAYGMPEADEGAELELEYRTPEFDKLNNKDVGNPPTDTFLTIQRTQSVEMVSEADQGLYYTENTCKNDNDLLEVDANVTSRVALQDVRITWHRVQNPPWDTFRNRVGTINDAAFLDHAEEQVMFMGVQDQRQFNTDGTVLWNLTMQFNARVPKFNNGTGTMVEGGWNHFPVPPDRRDTNKPYWAKVYRKATSQADADLLYLKTDFTDLFKAD